MRHFESRFGTGSRAGVDPILAWQNQSRAITPPFEKREEKHCPLPIHPILLIEKKVRSARGRRPCLPRLVGPIDPIQRCVNNTTPGSVSRPLLLDAVVWCGAKCFASRLPPQQPNTSRHLIPCTAASTNVCSFKLLQSFPGYQNNTHGDRRSFGAAAHKRSRQKGKDSSLQLAMGPNSWTLLLF
jgi:hypothetical protein